MMMSSLTTTAMSTFHAWSCRSVLMFSVIVFLSCMTDQHNTVLAQWGGPGGSWGSREGGGGGLFSSWVGGPGAEEQQEEMEERGGMRGGTWSQGRNAGGLARLNTNRRMNGEMGGGVGGSVETGGSSAQAGMMEMPSWMTVLQNFLRVRIEMWRQQYQKPQQQQLSVSPSLQPQPPLIGGSLARNTPDVLPDASSGLFGLPVGTPRGRGDSPVIEPTSEPEPPTSEPEPEPPVLEPEPVTLPPVLPRFSRRHGSSSSSEAFDFMDLNNEIVAVDAEVKPTGGPELKRWECNQQGGVCASRCENPSDTIDIVDCGMGPRGILSCCEQ